MIRPVGIMVAVTDGKDGVLASGFGSGGERWTLAATPGPGRLRAMVEVVEPTGRRWVAGSTGPALPPGHRCATFVGRSGESAHLVIVRVADDVRAVVATLTDGTREDLRLHGDARVLGARLAVLVCPAGPDLQHLAVIGADGEELPELV
ncbi:hypothetical protein ACVBEQ_19040 [Nakamurella sp. GG22]